MMNVMAQGLNGMQQSQRHMLTSAQGIARAGYTHSSTTEQPQAEPSGGPEGQNIGSLNTTRDLTEHTVNLKREEHVFTASAKVVSVADKMLGTLLDIQA